MRCWLVLSEWVRDVVQGKAERNEELWNNNISSQMHRHFLPFPWKIIFSLCSKWNWNDQRNVCTSIVFSINALKSYKHCLIASITYFKSWHLVSLRKNGINSEKLFWVSDSPNRSYYVFYQGKSDSSSHHKTIQMTRDTLGKTIVFWKTTWRFS